MAVLIADKGESEFTRDIVVQKKDNKLQSTSESHPANDALSYTLIFVNGDLVWSPEMTYFSSDQFVRETAVAQQVILKSISS